MKEWVAERRAAPCLSTQSGQCSCILHGDFELHLVVGGADSLGEAVVDYVSRVAWARNLHPPRKLLPGAV